MLQMRTLVENDEQSGSQLFDAKLLLIFPAQHPNSFRLAMLLSHELAHAVGTSKLDT